MFAHRLLGAHVRGAHRAVSLSAACFSSSARCSNARSPAFYRIGAAAAAGGAAAGLCLLGGTSQPAVAAPQMTENRVLGGPAWAPEADRKHRVGITAWAIRDPREQHDLDATAKSFKTPDDLCRWLGSNGYDGMELTVDDFRARWWPDVPREEIARRISQLTQAHDCPIIGSLFHVSDGGPACGPQELDFEQPDFWPRLEQMIGLEKTIGSEYVTFQICLPEKHMGTGGAYRNDDAYLRSEHNHAA